jgi:hypothetical protein
MIDVATLASPSSVRCGLAPTDPLGVPELRLGSRSFLRSRVR